MIKNKPSPPGRRPARQQKRAPVAVAPVNDAEVPPDATEVARLARGAVLCKAEVIAASLIRCAEEGSCPHARFLFELAGLYPAAPLEEAPDEEGPLAALVERLR